MEVKTLPHSLSEVTLEKYVGWYPIYGKHLLKVGRRKGKTADEEAAFQLAFMLRHYAWYSDTPLDEVEAIAKDGGDDTVIAIIKEASLSQAEMFRELCSIEYVDFNTAQFEWNGGMFKIQAPVIIDDTTKVSVAQFEKCQDIALIFSDLQDENYEALYELCVEYLAPIDPYSTEGTAWIATPKDAKINIVKSLPLHIAMCVKTFVTTTINLYKQLRRDGTTTAD